MQTGLGAESADVTEDDILFAEVHPDVVAVDLSFIDIGVKVAELGVDVVGSFFGQFRIIKKS